MRQAQPLQRRLLQGIAHFLQQPAQPRIPGHDVVIAGENAAVRDNPSRAVAQQVLELSTRVGTHMRTEPVTPPVRQIVHQRDIAIVVPGRMFKNAFDAKKLHPKNLSRALENSGTMTSPLIPWNSCGAFMGATLGISPLLYLPYAFLNLSVPMVSIFYGYTGITMEKVDQDKS